MPLRPAVRSSTSKQRPASLWRSGYAWRWGTPHPVAKKDSQQWFITASMSLKKLRTEENLSDSQVRDFIEWYFAWFSFRASARQSHCEHPAVVNAKDGNGNRWIVAEWQAWMVRYSYMLSQASIHQVAQQYRGTDHVSPFAPPWEVE